jgi:thiol-disulfide isomerase/thioredoxin
MTEPTPDKNIIGLTVYQKNDIQLHAYTALWCGPCKRIKPKLIEIMSKHNYKVIEEKNIAKSDFKKDVNEFVPFFVVKNGEKVDSIQTSDEMLFTQFLTKNSVTKLDLDDNF